MPDTSFFPRAEPLTLGEVAVLTEADLPPGADAGRSVRGVAPLDTAGPDDLAYMDNPRYAEALAATRAGICLVTRRFADRAPAEAVALVTPRPHDAMARVLARLYPTALRPGSLFGSTGVSAGSIVHPTARLERGAVVDPGAVVGPGAEIGSGTVVAAQAVIGPGVRIGRDCAVGPNVSVVHALIGNRVILHAGARIGQDGFGYAMGAKGHRKVPQVGRVIIQDDVEVGANTTIDRGGSRDTVIGEGTKIDNQVQIGHNCIVGRHCVIVGQVGISGSTTLDDFVVMAGKSSTVGHLRIGAGAQIAGDSNVKDDVPAGARYGGSPAKPVREWFREMATLKRLASRPDLAKDGDA